MAGQNGAAVAVLILATGGTILVVNAARRLAGVVAQLMGKVVELTAAMLRTMAILALAGALLLAALVVLAMTATRG